MSIADHRLALEYWAVLSDVKKQQSVTLAGHKFIYTLKDNTAFVRSTGVVLDEDYRQLLLKLAEMGAYTLQPIPRRQIAPTEFLPELEMPVNQYYLEINLPKFDEMYEEYGKSARLAPNRAASAQDTAFTVRLVKSGRVLLLRTPNGDVPINEFRADMQPEKLVNYLLHHRAGAVVKKSDLVGLNLGLENIGDISETLRRAGFTKLLKSIFVPICASDKVQLLDTNTVSAANLELALAELRSPTHTDIHDG